MEDIPQKLLLEHLLVPNVHYTPQHQHIADFTSAFKAMSDTIDIIKLDEPNQIFESYKYAYERTDNKSTILVEWGDYYNEK
jgi:hypothetical protein